MEAYLLADAEIHHLRVRSHLAQESETRDDLVVELNQFIFSQAININLHL
jgi:hypothetical protein